MWSRDAILLSGGIAVGLVLNRLVAHVRNKSQKGTGHAVRDGLQSNSIRLPKQTLVKLMANILCKAGASAAHAEQAANVLAFADERGIPSHGANRCDFYAKELQSGCIDGHAEPKLESCSGCCAVVDGCNCLGATVSSFAMAQAIELGRKYGMAYVACRNSNHYGAAGFWAAQAMEAGFCGFSFTNTAPFAAPTGGRTRAVGTNPFCFFAPGAAAGSAADSFQLDMATTVVPIGKIEVLDRIGEAAPLGWGVDRHGEACSNAAEIVQHGALFPLGGAAETAGYKGYGLGMFVEIMSSVFSGAKVGPDVQEWSTSRATNSDFGHAFIVIDPARFTPGFDARLQRYMDQMRSLPGDVKVPGDPERAFERDADANGIALHRGVAATLKALAESYGVPAPVELSVLDAAVSRGSLYR